MRALWRSSPPRVNRSSNARGSRRARTSAPSARAARISAKWTRPSSATRAFSSTRASERSLRPAIS